MVLAVATLGAVFLLASAEPYARSGKAMINKSLTIGNAPKTGHRGSKPANPHYCFKSGLLKYVAPGT